MLYSRRKWVLACTWRIWSNSTGSWITLGDIWCSEYMKPSEMRHGEVLMCLFSRQKYKMYFMYNQHQGRVYILWAKLTSSRTQITMKWKVQHFLPASQCLRRGYFKIISRVWWPRWSPWHHKPLFLNHCPSLYWRK